MSQLRPPFPLEGGRAGDGGGGACPRALVAVDTATVSSSSTPIPTLPPSRGKGLVEFAHVR